MKERYIYSIRNNVNGKKYIGQTCNPTIRMRRHLGPRSDCPALASAVKKYGSSSFSVTMLARGLSQDESNELERAMISLIGTMVPLGYNLTEGGDGGSLSPESMERWTASMKNVFKSPEYKKKQSQSQSDRRRREAADGYIHPRLSQEAADRRRTHLALMRADPELSRLRKEAVASALRKPGVMKNAGIASKARWAIPEFRAKMLAQTRTPEARSKMVASMRLVYADPEMRRIRGEAISRGLSARKARLAAEAVMTL